MFQKGVTLLEGGDPGAALQEFQKALANAVGEGKGDSLFNIAICYVRLDDMDMAMQAIAEAVTIDPSLVEEIRKDQDFAPLWAKPAFEDTLAAAVQQYEAQQRAKGDPLRQQLRDLEPACREHRKKVWTIIGIGGLFFLLFGAGAAGNGVFGGLAMLAFVATFFALQRVTLHSPVATAQKLRVEIEKIEGRLSVLGALSDVEQTELARKAAAMVKSGRGFFLFLLALATFGLVGMVAIPFSNERDPAFVFITFVFLTGAFMAMGFLFVSSIRAKLRDCLGWQPGMKQVAMALLTGRFDGSWVTHPGQIR
jgi:tetratricopeptide (TPR) repeat protein